MSGKLKLVKGNRALNPKSETLTVERLKQFQGWESVSDEEAEQAINHIKVVSAILIDLLKREESEQTINQELKEAA